MSESDFDMGLKRVHSRKEPVFQVVPKDSDFRLRIVDINSEPIGLLYTLKEGQTLPYEPDLEGYKVVFGTDLKPHMDRGNWQFKMENNFWKFTNMCDQMQNQTSPLHQSQSQTTPLHQGQSQTTPLQSQSQTTPLPQSQTTPVHQSQTSTVQSDDVFSWISQTEIVSPLRSSQTRSPVRLRTNHTPDLSLDSQDTSFLSNNSDHDDNFDEIDELVIEEAGRAAPFTCGLCSFVSQIKSNSQDHIRTDHPGWKNEVKAAKSTVTVVPTANNQPDWKAKLKMNYQNLIIENCSKMTRDAVAANEVIKNQQKMRSVRNEVINMVVNHLVIVFGEVGCPNEGNAGYGSGGNSGLSRLPAQMIDRFRDKERKKSREDAPEDAEDETPRKRGKKKDIYGLDNKKYYSAKGYDKANQEISKANTETDFNKREAVYAANRGALTYVIRSKQKNHFNIFFNKNMCRGFFLHPDHLAYHFTDLTSTESLTVNVKKNFRKQTDLLLAYLKHKNKNKEFRDKIAAIEERVEVNYNGARTYHDIEILRMAGTFLDEDGSVLIRYKTELPGATSSPFIVAIEIDGNFHFEVHVEGRKLLENLDIAEAIGSLLHLSFVFDLKYLKETETLCDILQRRYAKYGDDSGSTTNRKKTSAEMKMSKYLETLGQLLTDN